MNITYYLRKEKRVNNFVVRDYIARLDDMTPVDSFQLFYSNGQWVAWTSDTLNRKTAKKRRRFAAKLNCA